MEKYTTYCTDEQTRRAYKLSAPLEIFDPDNSNGILIDDKAFAIPTTQQMIGWLREVGFRFYFIEYPHSVHWEVRFSLSDYTVKGDMVIEKNCNFELIAIDTALDYLEKEMV